MAYTQVTVSGYNSGPPSDDGASTSNNGVKWITIKTKLFDPLNTALALIDDRASSAFVTADTALTTLQAAITAAAANVSALSTTLNAPATTQTLFKQTAPPTGWTKGTDLDDYALRLVTGTPSTGGSTAFSTILKARTIATANLPVHSHNFSTSATAITFSGTTFTYDMGASGSSAGGSGSFRSVISDTSDTTNTLTGTVSISGTTVASGSGGTWNFAVLYCDVIYATKA